MIFQSGEGRHFWWLEMLPNELGTQLVSGFGGANFFGLGNTYRKWLNGIAKTATGKTTLERRTATNWLAILFAGAALALCIIRGAGQGNVAIFTTTTKKPLPQWLPNRLRGADCKVHGQYENEVSH
ncbi:MAG: hypothetical protein R2830_25755 [Saprospiraceae bacterium]